MAKSDIRKKNAKNIEYWANREKEQRDFYGELTHKEIRREYYFEYMRMLKEVTNLMENFYTRITVNGTPTANEMYKYNRYYEMQNDLREIVSNYGKAYWKILDPKFKKLYITNCTHILTTYNLKNMDRQRIEKVAKNLWNANGRHWQESVWVKPRKTDTPLTAIDRRANGLFKLQTTLEKGLMDCVARGAPKDDLVREIKERCQVDWHEADRLVRTELTHLQNQSTLDGYKASGVTEYRYFAHEDERTSEICHRINNKIYPIAKAEVGVNYPPMHPNCRSTTVPVVNGYAPTSKTLQENADRKKKLQDEYTKGVIEYKQKNNRKLTKKEKEWLKTHSL